MSDVQAADQKVADFTQPTEFRNVAVEVEVSEGGKVLWVDVEGRCVCRVHSPSAYFIKPQHHPVIRWERRSKGD